MKTKAWMVAMAALVTTSVGAQGVNSCPLANENVRVFQFCDDDEDDDDDHDCDDDFPVLAEKEVRDWVKKHTPWAEKALDEELQENPREKKWILEDVSGLIHEYREVKQFSEEGAKLMLEMSKLEFEMDAKFDELEDAGVEDEEKYKEAIRPIAKKLVPVTLKLEKLMLEAELEEIKQELKELEAAQNDVDKLVEELIGEILAGDEEEWEEEDEDDDDDREDEDEDDEDDDDDRKAL